MQDLNRSEYFIHLSKEALIGPLLNKLYSKPAPSKTLNDITFKRLSELEAINKVDHKSLWIGSLIADLFIYEARKAQDLKIHLPLAIEFAKQFIKENRLKDKEKLIILEIIETHHGGNQIYLESKLFKIADCHKFLEPAGLIDLISDYYQKEGSSLTNSLILAENKLLEKYKLIQDVADLDMGFDVENNYVVCSDFLKKAYAVSGALK